MQHLKASAKTATIF